MNSLFCSFALRFSTQNGSFYRAAVSDSLTSLFTKERQEQFPFFEERIALLLTKNERIARKTDEQISNPVTYPH